MEIRYFLVYFLVVFINVSKIFGEIYTAQVELVNLVKAKESVIQILKGYLGREKKRLGEFQEHLEEFLERGKGRKSGEILEIVENPLNAFLLVKSLSTDLEYLLNLADDTRNSEGLKKELKAISDDQELPTSEDLTGAAQAIIRLQTTYKLEAGSMSLGLLGPHCCASPLKVEDLYEMGRQSFFSRDYPHTIEWMNEALLKYAEHEQELQFNSSVIQSRQVSISQNLSKNLGKRRISKSDIQGYLSSAQQIQSVFDMTREMLQDVDFSYENIVDSITKAAYYGEKEIWGEDTDGKVVDKSKYSWVKSKYESLCRGELPKKVFESQLRCKYHGGSPYLLIGPAREEIINLDPLVRFYHGVLHDSEIDHLKEMAKPKLATSLVQNYADGGSQFSNVRTSKNTWIDDADDPIVEKISKRIAAITGLSMESAEELQIANYGLGGHYEPHYDFSFAVPQKGTFEHFEEGLYGNRIATFLFYMSDVKAGGATVFPSIELAVWPEKGGASFWYNLHDDGEPDYRTRHAACPVLLGTKWVSNSWIHERGQEFRRQCKPKKLSKIL